jgi:hypothetical protein
MTPPLLGVAGSPPAVGPLLLLSCCRCWWLRGASSELWTPPTPCCCCCWCECCLVDVSSCGGLCPSCNCLVVRAEPCWSSNAVAAPASCSCCWCCWLCTVCRVTRRESVQVSVSFGRFMAHGHEGTVDSTNGCGRSVLSTAEAGTKRTRTEQPHSSILEY